MKKHNVLVVLNEYECQTVEYTLNCRLKINDNLGQDNEYNNNTLNSAEGSKA